MVASKQCFKCELRKNINSFYMHKEMADGHLGKCIKCSKKDALNHRRQNIESIRAYDRKRGKLSHRKQLTIKNVKIYKEKYPERYVATMLLASAVRNGKVTKPKMCQDCNRFHKVLHGHHVNYGEPLEVVWLCPPCHKARHIKIKRAG